jgi:hypothetical protein
MNGRLPLFLLAVTLLVTATLFGLSRRQANQDVAALKEVLGRQLCRQVAQAEEFKPTKDFPRSLIEKSIRNLQESRRDLGLKPCPRKKEE